MLFGMEKGRYGGDLSGFAMTSARLLSQMLRQKRCEWPQTPMQIEGDGRGQRSFCCQGLSVPYHDAREAQVFFEYSLGCLGP